MTTKTTGTIKGFIFDLDGVIVFTDKLHYQAWKRMADRLGIPFDETVNDRLRGVSREESLDIILENAHGPALDAEEKRRLAEEKNTYYRELLEELTPDAVEEKVKDTLVKLRQRGFRLAIGSSSKNAGLILERTGIAGLFDAVSDGNNIQRSKPDPEVFLDCSSSLGVEPCECIGFEDSQAGIEAIKRAGMYAVGIGVAVTNERPDMELENTSQLCYPEIIKNYQEWKI